MVESLDRAADAMQNIVTDQIALLKTDTSVAVTSATRRGAMMAAGGALLLVGWIAALLAAQVALAPRIGLLETTLMLAGLNLFLGGVLVLAARNRTGGVRHG